MIRVTTFAGRTVAVFGLGSSGIATSRALIEGGAAVAAWDDGEAGRADAARAGIPLVDLRGADWGRFAALVLAPGVPLTHPEPHWTVKQARAAGVQVIGDVELFLRERAKACPDAPVVAITGTNGKSTTTALTAHILSTAGRDVQMGGNIGVPVLALEPPARDRIHVLELSSFQIDLTPSLAPTVGVLLNLTPDHLDRHGTMENYVAVKERLVATAGVAIIAAEDDWCRAIAARLEAARPQGGVVRVGSTRLDGIATLRGLHNGQNAAAAIAVARRLDVAAADIDRALRTYPGLPHRMEEVGTLAKPGGRILFINDSKATNADSTEKALASWERDIFVLLGGKPKEGGIAALAPYFPRIAKAYLIGQASDAFAATLEGKVAYQRCGTLDKALAAATRDAAVSTGTEPVVLLSPACASYDQFKSFEHRGDEFRRMVRALSGIVRGGSA